MPPLQSILLSNCSVLACTLLPLHFVVSSLPFTLFIPLFSDLERRGANYGGAASRSSFHKAPEIGEKPNGTCIPVHGRAECIHAPLFALLGNLHRCTSTTFLLYILSNLRLYTQGDFVAKPRMRKSMPGRESQKLTRDLNNMLRGDIEQGRRSRPPRYEKKHIPKPLKKEIQACQSVTFLFASRI